MIGRTIARSLKLQKVPYELEDIFMYLAWASFTTMTALYYSTIHEYFYLIGLSMGLEQPYPGFQKDASVMLQKMFAVQFIYWLSLWSVKWSLLFMFKKLTKGLPGYTYAWWGILAFTILTLIGNFISNFTSCSSMKAWFNAGSCETDRDSKAKLVSLWFSMGADILCDLLSK